jgi:NADPH:quinone reductase-like Zn-dependent oxidoreductase
MNTMRAVRAHRRGGPEQLVYEVAPRPEPAPGEVLVAVHAASITSDELTWDATWTDSLEPGAATGHRSFPRTRCQEWWQHSVTGSPRPR